MLTYILKMCRFLVILGQNYFINCYKKCINFIDDDKSLVFYRNSKNTKLQYNKCCCSKSILQRMKCINYEISES